MDLETLPTGSLPKQVGRYTIFQQIAAGGMATVHLARFTGPMGFTRVVAVKHLHQHLSSDPAFRAMFIDEARLVSRIRHPNVVPTLDVIAEDADIFIVMEYVQGESLGALQRTAAQQRREIPLAICSALLVGALHGLHAAHEARSESGESLNIVHRDVTPSNILVGVDGIPVVIDFGVAKALQERQDTPAGALKGKASYMAAEQIRGEPLTRATDIFAAAVVFWELLTSRRLFLGPNDQERIARVLRGTDVRPPSTVASRVPASLDEIALKGLRANPAQRYQTARAMADAIEQAIPPASQRVVGAWVAQTAAASLSRRADLLQQIEFPGISKHEVLTSEAVTEQPTPSGDPDSEPTRPGTPVPGTPAARPARWRDRRVVIAGFAAALVAGVAILAVSGSGPPRAAVTPRSSGRAMPAKVQLDSSARAPRTAPAPVTAESIPDLPDQRVSTPAKAARDHLAVRRPGPSTHARRGRGEAIQSVAAGADSGEAQSALAPETATAARDSPTASAHDVKRRVPLVEDQPRVQILE